METISLELESPTTMIVGVVTTISVITVCLMFIVLKSKSKKREILFISLVTASTALMLLGAFGANHINEQRNVERVATAASELGETLNQDQLQQLKDTEALELNKNKIMVLSDEGTSTDLILYDAEKNLEDQQLIEDEQAKMLGSDS